MSKSKSQTGGEGSFRALTYQKKFLAYLCLLMISGKNSIKSITCEQDDDVLVQEESTIKYYQVKSTINDSLRIGKVYEAIELFLCNENKQDDANAKYVIVSGSKILGIEGKDSLKEYYLKEKKKKIKSDVLEKIMNCDAIIDRIYYMRGPALEEINSVIHRGFYNNYDKKTHYDWDGILNELFGYIDNMCPGIDDIQDKKIIHESESELANIKHKTITKDIIDNIVEKHKISYTQPDSTKTDKKTSVTKTLTIRFNIMPTCLSKEEKDEILELLGEYQSFSIDDEKRFTYMTRFEKYSKIYDLYRYDKFLNFLLNEYKNSCNKHIKLRCLNLLLYLIDTSKTEDESSFLEYIKKEYFELFKTHLLSLDDLHDYSVSKVEQILKELSGIVSSNELCDTYWARLVKLIVDRTKSGKSDNRLGNCVEYIKKNCTLKKEWRKWLIASDAYSEIKDNVLAELFKG